MKNGKNSKRYKFYLVFNTISVLMVFILPLMVGSIYALTHRPDACDQTNTFLTWILIFALNLVNLKFTLEIFEKYNFIKENKNES